MLLAKLLVFRLIQRCGRFRSQQSVSDVLSSDAAWDLGCLRTVAVYQLHVCDKPPHRPADAAPLAFLMQGIADNTYASVHLNMEQMKARNNALSCKAWLPAQAV